jgi:hypothetical protein
VARYRTSACVVNGPAYGPGFGLICGGDQHLHFPDAPTLFRDLLQLITG